MPNICEDVFHLIGDSAYPCKKWILVPFKDYGHLTSAQRNFNDKLSQCSVKIENAFGLLKIRFRQLQRTDFNTRT